MRAQEDVVENESFSSDEIPSTSKKRIDLGLDPDDVDLIPMPEPTPFHLQLY